jgi:hypothetical protein
VGHEQQTNHRQLEPDVWPLVDAAALTRVPHFRRTRRVRATTSVPRGPC